MESKKGKDLLNIEPEWQFDKEAIAQKQAKLRIFLDKAIKDGSVQQLQILSRDYESIKYKGNLYQLGSYLQIYDISLKEPYIGKLVRIVQIDKKLEQMPFLQIQWCLKKKDLPIEILDVFGKHISVAQIFPSNLRYCIHVPGIKGKCQIFELEQYSQMAISYENYYFTRSNYNGDKRELIPHPSTWKTQCFCGAPQNPDLKYICCEKCQNWFHNDCISIEEKDLGDSFICKDCLEFSWSSKESSI